MKMLQASWGRSGKQQQEQTRRSKIGEFRKIQISLIDYVYLIWLNHHTEQSILPLRKCGWTLGL